MNQPERHDTDGLIADNAKAQAIYESRNFDRFDVVATVAFWVKLAGLLADALERAEAERQQLEETLSNRANHYRHRAYEAKASFAPTAFLTYEAMAKTMDEAYALVVSALEV